MSACIYQYLVQVCTNPIKYLFFGASTCRCLILLLNVAAINTWSLHTDIVGPHALDDARPFTL